MEEALARLDKPPPTQPMRLDPEDIAPDEDFQVVTRDAMLAAQYHLTLKDKGLSEWEACELTREWMAHCFESNGDEIAD